MYVNLRVGGVPEHFNAPWHLALEQGHFAAVGLQVDFQLYPTGTGAMCADLRAGKLDLAVVLTEGIVSDMLRQGGSRILAAYVPSPLQWGIHVAADAPFTDPSELRGQTLAISRFGSGSHLMAMLWAHEQGWHPREDLAFYVAGGISPLEEAVCSGRAAAFFWEKYTTAPRVAAGHLRCLGIYPTPWPSFVLAVREDLLETQQSALWRLLQVLYAQTRAFMAGGQASVDYVSRRYGLSPEQTWEWFSGVRWATDPELEPAVLEEVLRRLASVGILEGSLPAATTLLASL